MYCMFFACTCLDSFGLKGKTALFQSQKAGNRSFEYSSSSQYMCSELRTEGLGSAGTDTTPCLQLNDYTS
jgi:hypothetical protein